MSRGAAGSSGSIGAAEHVGAPQATRKDAQNDRAHPFDRAVKAFALLFDGHYDVDWSDYLDWSGQVTPMMIMLRGRFEPNRIHLWHLYQDDAEVLKGADL